MLATIDITVIIVVIIVVIITGDAPTQTGEAFEVNVSEWGW